MFFLEFHQHIKEITRMVNKQYKKLKSLIRLNKRSQRFKICLGILKFSLLLSI